jgi:hypothetical protein
MTEFAKEKLNILNNLIMQAATEQFQLQLIAKAANKTTGSQQADDMLIATANGTAAQLVVCERRLEVYRAEAAVLSAELGS